MGDEDDGRARLGQLAHDGHELVGLLRGEDGRGLVEDQHLRLAGQGLDDLDALLGADGQVLDQRIGIQVESEARRHLLHGLARFRRVDEAGPAHRLESEGDGFGDREDGDEHEVLVDHADPRGHRVPRPVEAHGLAVDEDLALVGLVEAVQDVHESRLARAVLAEERVDVAFFNSEVDVVVRDEGAEPFGDPLEFQFHA